MAWVVVQVKSLLEDYAIKNLEESRFRCYCPKLTLRKGDKVSSVPLFRGYIFTEIELGDVQRWRTIRSHRGVLRLMSTPNGMPAILPKGFVEALMAQGELVQEPIPLAEYVKGQKIVFTAGPLQGISGIVHASNRERVSLLIDMLGSEKIVQSNTRMIASMSAV